MPDRKPWASRLLTPSMMTVLAFATAIATGTGLLMLPVAHHGPHGASAIDALFTTTSAICVTGLTINDTPHYWTMFGQVTIAALIQIGGFGIMTMASLIGYMISRRFGLRVRLNAAAEVYSDGLHDVRRIVLGVGKISLTVESVAALILAARFYFRYSYTLQHSIWLGIFHAISAFNNAGFALFSNNLMDFVKDPVISNVICICIILGGLGFPVILELTRTFRKPSRWSFHTKVVVTTTALLLVGGTIFITAMEWHNTRTMGHMSASEKVLAGWFQAVNPRTAGFNTIDIGSMHQQTWLGIDFLMFIGGATGSTAGGIKVTTFSILLLVLLAEVRQHDDVSFFRRTVRPETIREALTVGLLAVGIVCVSTLVLLCLTPYPLERVLFEDLSALGTVGLSTGITAAIDHSAQLVLVCLMFIGRLGPLALAGAIVARERPRRFRYPVGEIGIG